MATKGADGLQPTDECLQKLGPYDFHRHIGYRIRKKLRPNLPSNLDEVDIESFGELATCLDGGTFYRGTTPTNSVLFMSDKQREIAANSSALFIDGTFSICPKPYKQVLVLRGKTETTVHTIAYALLPNKKEKTYSDVLHKMKDICATAGHATDFAFVHSDCEHAIINSVRTHFPETDIRLCHFHVADAIRRQVASLGLKAMVGSCPDFRALYETSRNLFYFPSQTWPALWENTLSSLNKDVLSQPAVTKFVKYMETVWVPTTLPIRNNSVQFRPTNTCLFKGDDGTLTNNFSESYNARLKTKFGNDPNLAKFLRHLRKEVFNVEVEYAQRHARKFKRKPADRERLARRLSWESALQIRLEEGDMDGVGLLAAMQQIIAINRITSSSPTAATLAATL